MAAVMLNSPKDQPHPTPVPITGVDPHLRPKNLRRSIPIKTRNKAQRLAFIVLIRVPKHAKGAHALDEVVGKVARDISGERADAHVGVESVGWPVFVSCFVQCEGLVVESLACQAEGFAWGFGGCVEVDGVVGVCFDCEGEVVDLVAEFAREDEEEAAGLGVG